MENSDNLPGYIKESKPVDNVEQTNASTTQLSHIQAVENFRKRVHITAERYPSPVEKRDWEYLVASVASGHPSAFDINRIKILTDENDPEATEILAWMYAKGVGVRKSLKTSWFLYMKASELGVENARNNAELIHRAMSAEEKRELLDF